MRETRVAVKHAKPRMVSVGKPVNHMPSQAASGKNRLQFELQVRNNNRSSRLVKLIATCGQLDVDDPQPTANIRNIKNE